MEGETRIHSDYDDADDDDNSDGDDDDAGDYEDAGDGDDELGSLVKGCIRASPHRISAAAPNSINLTSLPLSSSSSLSSS